MKSVRVQVLKLGINESGRVTVRMAGHGRKAVRFKVKPFSFEGLSLGLQEHCGLEPRDAAHVVRHIEDEIVF